MEPVHDDPAMSDSLQPPPAEPMSATSSYDASVNGNPQNPMTPPEDVSPPTDPIDTSMADHDDMDEFPASPDAPDPPPSHRLGAVEPHDAAIVDSEDTPSHTDSDAASGMVELPKVEVLLTPPPDPVLPYSSSRTGLVYDPRMRYHTEIGANEDDIHPEDPRRIFEIFNELKNAGLVETDYDSDEFAPYPRQRLLRINARHATPAEVCLVHDPAHFEWVMGLKSWEEARLKVEGKAMDSVYLHTLTPFCSLLSAGGAIEATRAVVVGQVKNSIAVIRPPGHHAEHNVPGGFCFFNNVCIAARVCQQDFPTLCRKILILDWDVHHGNGIQNIFEDDPNVLYISLHVYQDAKFYPNSPRGNHLHVGVGEGEGKNVNIPWPQHFMSDGDYLHAFQQVVMPIAQEFNPDLVIIAAGFDAAEGDTLGLCHVTPTGFAHMTHMLMSLAGGKVAACLEGGYNLRSIAKSALAVTRTLMGEPPPRLYDIEPSLPGIAAVKLVIAEHARYWKCLYPKESPEKRVERMGGERLHDILRERQALSFFSKYKMSPLFVLHEKLSRSFENQVLATSDYCDPKPMLVIFHDPPETIGIYDPASSKLDSHNVIVTDVSVQYIEWAVKEGFSVIDVNIPKHITASDNREIESAEQRTAATNDLVSYLWENYIEINNPSHIFFLGIGAATAGIISVLNTHERTSDHVNCIINFIAEQTLMGVNRPADDYFASWYYSRSTVYVAENHQVWSPDRARKIRRKYGCLVKSSQTNINDMLLEHKAAVFQKLRDETADWRSENPKRPNGDHSLPDVEMDGVDPVTPRPASSPETAGRDRRFSTPVKDGAEGADAGGSPTAAKLESPGRLPPLGVFSVTTPERMLKDG